MTKREFYDWLIAHGCQVTPLPEYHQGTAVKVTHAKASRPVYVVLPINDNEMKHFVISKQCMQLGIPIPNEAEYLKELAELVKKHHYLK